MNSACSPLAVCSITHGAIFAATAGFVAREELIAASAVMTAAPNNNEETIRRPCDAMNVPLMFPIIVRQRAPIA
jgi:hypothetical protein